MISKEAARPLAWGLSLGASVFLVQHLFGDVPARWLAVALMVAALLDFLVHRVSRSGYWIARGVDSEVGEPCWLVKGGPFVCHDDDTVAELGTWWQARRYVARSERLMTEAIRRRARG
ncbi:hypothetical protein [Streptomyces sp. V4I2]|uniref:hypothetical protein n=1 Tax=Streptomyces sp. V4I2 TaxID=3042280 RepID=UPI00277F9A5A|nr:hypothetical protein [Streptomyces sp. V4I2]MDQ1041783.1 hypothetical protein [Streptomyces sp. V4I2]